MKAGSGYTHWMNGSVVPTRFWHVLDDGRVQCDLCPRACKLHEGQQGLCFVRACQNAEIVLTSYGRSSGFAVDPIEKKPLAHFLPGTPVLSFGTAGCNLACKFCQNWDMSKSREIDTLAESASPEQLVQAALDMECRSIAYTYNDPVVFHEYAIDVAAVARERGVRSVAVTAGYICEEPRREFFAAMDATNIDLKAFNEDFYYKLCGAHLQDVLDTLCYVQQETDVWLEITTLLIPGQNDSNAELESLCQWVVENLGPDVPHHFSAFHPDWKMRDVGATPAQTLSRARDIARAAGIRHAYTGNVHDAEGSSTWCHHCGCLLIERDWYEMGRWELAEGGVCPRCSTRLPGVFEAQPGGWGLRRQRVSFVN
jgi:pyruvate formate lyase activating enzyme